MLLVSLSLSPGAKEEEGLAADLSHTHTHTPSYGGGKWSRKRLLSCCFCVAVVGRFPPCLVWRRERGWYYMVAVLGEGGAIARERERRVCTVLLLLLLAYNGPCYSYTRRERRTDEGGDSARIYITEERGEEEEDQRGALPTRN